MQGDSKLIAKIIAMAVRNQMEDFHCKHLSDSQMKELNPIIRNAIYTALVSIRNSSKSKTCLESVRFQMELIPHYWEEPELHDEFKSFAKTLGEDISELK